MSKSESLQTSPPKGPTGQQVRVLVAEDDAVSRRLIQASLEQWGWEPVLTKDGNSAWKVFSGPDAPDLGLIDWMMPGMDGPTLCRRVRNRHPRQPAYLILLTARGGREDLLAGLAAGADDYVTKPFDRAELRARIEVGLRVLGLQAELTRRIKDLELALAQVKQLKGLLPICMYCKRIRNDQNYWQQVESYIRQHSEAEFTHGICPNCFQKLAQGEPR